ncbi:MAG: transketolase [Spirochaetales bacterium]|nr:transketolase [Spirochaetales bacterium]
MHTEGILQAATAVRLLSMDAVQRANSGHPGLPMGCAELGVLVFGEIMRHYPEDPNWIDRDRFVLSAGHGSMLLYSLLHLSGYELPMSELQSFRQLGSRTPGHPEYGLTAGVETTTGPLGQGISNAVGMAMAERMLAARFNTAQASIIDHHTYVLAGDGDMMEGVSSEACSLAGHLGLGKLIVFYDSNRITIEGSTGLAFTEDVGRRFEAYGWQTLSSDAYDLESILKLVEQAKGESTRPSLILLRSVIGKGAPNLAGSHETHGAPLGEEEIRAAKRAMGISEDSQFHIPAAAGEYFAGRRASWEQGYQEWQKGFAAWSAANPELRKEWDRFFGTLDPDSLPMPEFQQGDKMATRKASGTVLAAISPAVPNLVGGSADLAPSNNTYVKGLGDFQADSPAGRNLHFGVREHGMGAICNGLALHGGLRAYCGTFLVFSDYMRPSVRLAALMGLPVVYVYTHDSVFVGEDGPTHQPVEHLAALRVIPNLVVLRPGDAQETAEAWRIALGRSDGPTALALTRQNLEVYAKDDPRWQQNLRHGAYVVSDSQGSPSLVAVATGSEVNLALEAKKALGPTGAGMRVVSMMSRELFLQAPEEYQSRLLPAGSARAVLEAGVSYGWGDVVGPGATLVCVDRFGESAPAGKIAEHLGLTAPAVAARLKPLL